MQGGLLDARAGSKQRGDKPHVVVTPIFLLTLFVDTLLYHCCPRDVRDVLLLCKKCLHLITTPKKSLLYLILICKKVLVLWFLSLFFFPLFLLRGEFERGYISRMSRVSQLCGDAYYFFVRRMWYCCSLSGPIEEAVGADRRHHYGAAPIPMRHIFVPVKIIYRYTDLPIVYYLLIHYHYHGGT